jgi:hypothetical protein
MSTTLQAAAKFVTQLAGGRRFSPQFPPDDLADVLKLAEAAFHLYQREWGSGRDIRKWQWPFDELERGDRFEGDEPWTVLLREAVGLYHRRRSRATSVTKATRR